MTAPRRLSADREDESEHRSRGTTQIWIGAVFLVIGIGITVATYAFASTSPSGGIVIVAYGPIVFGIATIIRGLIRRGE